MTDSALVSDNAVDAMEAYHRAHRTKPVGLRQMEIAKNTKAGGLRLPFAVSFYELLLIEFESFFPNFLAILPNLEHGGAGGLGEIYRFVNP